MYNRFEPCLPIGIQGNTDHLTLILRMLEPRLSHRSVMITGGSVSALVVYPVDGLALIALTNQSGAYPEEFLDELAGYFNPAIPLADPLTALRMQLQKRGFSQALAIADELKKQNRDLWPPENELNDWGYRMLNGGGIA